MQIRSSPHVWLVLGYENGEDVGWGREAVVVVVVVVLLIRIIKNFEKNMILEFSEMKNFGDKFVDI